MRKPTLILLALLTGLIPASSFAQIDIPLAGRYKKIIVVVGENLGYENLFGDPSHPACDQLTDPGDAGYIQTTLAGQALNYTNAHSSTHPSLPNYLRLFAGVDNGITEDGCVCDSPPPSPAPTCTPGQGSNPCPGHPCIECGPNGTTNSEPLITAMTLYGELKNDGVPGTNFVLWAEGLFDVPNDINQDPFICSNADYVQKHNAAAFFANSRNDECPPPVVWKGWAQGTPPPPPEQLLPTVNNLTNGVAFVIPGQDHNGHNGGGATPALKLAAKVKAWNNWLRDNIPQYVNYALNTDNKTLLIITQDEKSGNYCGDPNHIILFLISGDLTARTDGTQVGDANGPTAAEYNILRTITQNFSLGNLGNADASVPPLVPAL